MFKFCHIWAISDSRGHTTNWDLFRPLEPSWPALEPGALVARCQKTGCHSPVTVTVTVTVCSIAPNLKGQTVLLVLYMIRPVPRYIRHHAYKTFSGVPFCVFTKYKKEIWPCYKNKCCIITVNIIYTRVVILYYDYTIYTLDVKYFIIQNISNVQYF